MNFLELLEFALMIVESAALLGAVTSGIRGFKERKNLDKRKTQLKQFLIYFGIFAVLNMIRFTCYN